MTRLKPATCAFLLACLSSVFADDAGYPGYAELRARTEPLWEGRTASAGGAYVVLVADGSPLRPAAKRLAEYRKGEVASYSPAAPEDCLPDLIRRDARYVAIFAEPKDLDVNLLRKFIVISTLLDRDPFCDFAFGFVTASTPKKVEEFVDRIIAADRNGVPDYAVMVSASNISQKYAQSFLPGVEGESWYVKYGDTEFARSAIAQLARAGFVHLGACSDPEGIWLFDDQRNLDESKHWPFDPKKVGQDPKGEMPRITADYFKGLKLQNAVVWTHACHLGAVDRVFVEGDIVSTFGATEKLEEYRIPPGRSMALAILEAGASAYMCPIGANFGAQASLERDLATETGVPLGDVMRRGYHDVVMDTRGHPETIGVFVPGKPKHWDPDAFTNHNSPHHRCLYGDPAFAPFAKRTSKPSVEVSAREEDGGVRVAFRLTASGFDVGRTWYGNRGRGESGRGRFYEEVPVNGDVEEAWIREIRTSDADGKAFGISSHAVLVETIGGRTVLHVQIVSPDLTTMDYGGGHTAEMSVLQKAGATAEVTIRYGKRPEGKDGETSLPTASGGEKKTPEPAQPPKNDGEPAWKPGPVEETPEAAARLKALLADFRKARGPDEAVARGTAALAIGRLRTAAALKALLGLLAGEKESYVRSLLVSAVADVDGADAAAALLAALAAEEGVEARRQIRDAIVHALRSKEAAGVLLRQGLRHRHPRVRAAAAAALGRIGWADASDALVAATKDADAGARIAAIEALARFGGEGVLACLLALAAGDDEESAVAALGSLELSGGDDARVLELARAALAASKPVALRLQAARLLGARRDAAAAKALLSFLDSSDWLLRAAAVAAHGRIRAKEAIEPLIARLDAENGRLRFDVARALFDITCLDLGTDGRKWREWWKANGATFEVPPEPAPWKDGGGTTEVAYHDIPVVSRRIVFLLDVSASMAEAMDASRVASGPDGGPSGNTRLDFCKWELQKTIRRLPKDTKFNVVTFETGTHPWRPALATATGPAKAEAEGFVERQQPVGSTNLFDALELAFRDPEADTFYVLSDGQPTKGGLTNSAEILDRVRRRNAVRQVTIHTISAGELTAVTDNLLKKLAEQNGGRAVSLK
jgi:HEAT repeat protein